MAPRRRRHLLRLLPLLAAAGCAGAAGREEALREAMLSSQASLVAVGASPAWIPQGGDDGGAFGRAEPPRGGTARPRLAAAGPVPRSAAELVGLPPEALRQRLGEPDLRRVEGPAEIWLYAGTACALDLILYGERSGRGGPASPRVAHAAARASGTEPRTEAACLAEIASGGGTRGPVLPAGAARG